MKYLTIKILLAIAPIFLFISYSFAWDKKGHYLVAEIAENLISETVKRNVQKYLDNLSFEQASVWMDEMRTDHEYDYMKPWHYVTIEKGATYIPRDGNNIIERLNITYNELLNKQMLDQQKIHTDLLILFHLIGDLFQPLHVGYGSDRGGNEYEISLNGSSTNLHKVWDTDIIEHNNIDIIDCMKMYGNLLPTQIAYIKNTDFVGWMNENRKLLDGIYPANHQIDNDYLVRNKIVVEKQLLFAGIKLAVVLENVFGTTVESNNKKPNEKRKSLNEQIYELLKSISFKGYLIGAIILLLMVIGFYYYKK